MRLSYQAKVLLVPLGVGAVAVTDQLHAGAGLGAAPDTVADADMVVLVCTDPAQVDQDTVTEVTGSARDNGVLTAALILNADDPGPSGVALRDAVDMVVVLRDISLAIAFLAVLRGGDVTRTADDRPATRTPAGPPRRSA